MTQLRAQLKPRPLPIRQVALPDGDEVSGGLCLQQAEVEADAVTNGDGDQPDAVLGAGVGTGEARGVHSAIEGGDVPAAGDCQGEDTNRGVLQITSPTAPGGQVGWGEETGPQWLGGRERGDGAKDGRAWLFLLFPTHHSPRGPQSSAQVPLWACLSPEPSFLFLMKETCPRGRTHQIYHLSFPRNARVRASLHLLGRGRKL